MKQIPLSSGKYTLVDDDIYDTLILNKWSFKGRYAGRTLPKVNGKRKSVLMHRIILDAPEELEVDHINGDKLDNRKENLRLCTRTENRRNSRAQNKFKGVVWHKQKNKWMSTIKGKFLGYFDNDLDAAKAYNEAAKKEYGEFAWLNKVYL